jgi:hypothetical protein
MSEVGNAVGARGVRGPLAVVAGGALVVVAPLRRKERSLLLRPAGSGREPDDAVGRRRAGSDGNGDIYYAGMDNNAGAGGSGKPSFFAGDTVGVPPANPGEHTKYIAYPQTHVLSSSQASCNAATGVITLDIPRTDVGNPPDGTRLYSITAFSATSTTPQSSTTLFNLTDATTPFEKIVATVSGSRKR